MADWLDDNDDNDGEDDRDQTVRVRNAAGTSAPESNRLSGRPPHPRAQAQAQAQGVLEGATDHGDAVVCSFDDDDWNW